MTAARALVEMLSQYGVEVVFGLPGAAGLYDAFYDHPEIKHVLVRHEQCAAHMADGYARVSGKPGVCDGTSGPGTTNLITGLAEAYLSSIPVIALTGAIGSDQVGRGILQEVDQISILKPITKWNMRIEVASRMPELVRRAFQIATTGRPGPVQLELPSNVMMHSVDYPTSERYIHEKHSAFPATRVRPVREDVHQAVELLLQAKKAVMICGGGAITSGAWPEVVELAELLGIPVATTYMGKGSISETHPLSLGPAGAFGRTCANDVIQGSDLVLAVGTRLTGVDTAGWRFPAPEIPQIHIDIDPKEIGKMYPVKLGIVGDAKLSLQDILEELGSRAPREGRAQEVVQRMSHWRGEEGLGSPAAQSDEVPIHPLRVIRELWDVLDPEDIIVCDAGLNQIWGAEYFDVRSCGRTYLGTRGFGTMGFGFPAAVGAQLAAPERRLVAIVGDGGFAMTMQDLETAARIGAPVVTVMLDNQVLAFSRLRQRRTDRFISTAFGPIDFAGVARALGCFGRRVEQPGELKGALEEAFASRKPAVLDVLVTEEHIPHIEQR